MKQSSSEPLEKGIELEGPNGAKLVVEFDQLRLSSEGGLLVLASDPWTQHVFSMLAGALEDQRRAPKHTVKELLSQRILGIAAGWTDGNDAAHLRQDGVMQAAVGRAPGPAATLASQPTLCRLENQVSWRDLVRLFYAMIDLFLDSYGTCPPELLVLDVDPTACLTYGQQQLALFNTHVGGHCLMPFHLYEGQSGRLIATVLRPGKPPTAREILGLLRRVVRRIRARWPKVRLMLRADSHHTKTEVLDWLEAQGIDYALGYAPNAVLERQFAPQIREARAAYTSTARAGQPELEARRLHSGYYRAQSWSRERRVIVRAVASAQGVDVRYIVTSFAEASAKVLYEVVYCGRARAELFIKEHKLDLGGDRLSCTRAEANQLRLFLHSAAYVIYDGFRRRLLAGTALAHATIGQIRLKLIKVAARLDRTRRSLHLHLPWDWPGRATLHTVCERLRARSWSILAACSG